MNNKYIIFSALNNTKIHFEEFVALTTDGMAPFSAV